MELIKADRGRVRRGRSSKTLKSISPIYHTVPFCAPISDPVDEGVSDRESIHRKSFANRKRMILLRAQPERRASRRGCGCRGQSMPEPAKQASRTSQSQSKSSAFPIFRARTPSHHGSWACTPSHSIAILPLHPLRSLTPSALQTLHPMNKAPATSTLRLGLCTSPIRR